MIPQTMRYGTFLLSSYMGGAIVAHLTAGESPAFAAIVLALIWLLAYLRDPQFFETWEAFKINFPVSARDLSWDTMASCPTSGS